MKKLWNPGKNQPRDSKWNSQGDTLYSRPLWKSGGPEKEDWRNLGGILL